MKLNIKHFLILFYIILHRELVQCFSSSQYKTAQSFGRLPNVANICQNVHSQETVEPYNDYNDVNEVNEYSWKKYSSKEKKYTQYFRKHGIFYKTSLLTDKEFNIVKEELSKMPLKFVQETTNSVAHNRIGAQIARDSHIVNILANPEGSFIKLINEITIDKHLNNKNNTMMLSEIIPVEMRIYEKRGAGMEWHQDDLLYEPEQIEVVFTVENNSDCVTMWEQNNVNPGAQEIELKQVETEPNSAIILRAGPTGPRHAVSALKSGRRVILKLVFVRQDAIFMEENHSYQFPSHKSKKRKNKKQKK